MLAKGRVASYASRALADAAAVAVVTLASVARFAERGETDSLVGVDVGACFLLVAWLARPQPPDAQPRDVKAQFACLACFATWCAWFFGGDLFKLAYDDRGVVSFLLFVASVYSLARSNEDFIKDETRSRAQLVVVACMSAFCTGMARMHDMQPSVVLVHTFAFMTAFAPATTLEPMAQKHALGNASAYH